VPLHPQVRGFLDEVEGSGLPPLNELPADKAREQAGLMTEYVGAGPEVATVENFAIPASGGEIPARRYAPDDAAGVVLWIHGGGWVICDLESHDAMCRMLANASGCEVYAIHYRLAPEAPFPAPLEDSWDALKWVAQRTGGRPLIVGGDSAGGNMAAICALRARDRAGPELAQQVLVYPATDCDLDTPSYRRHGSGDETFLTTDEMSWFFDHYVADVAARTNPEVSPLRAADHSGLAPAVVVTAEYDPLRDDGLAYVGALRGAGVDVSHHHYDDMIHAFFTMVNLLERSDEAVARVGAEIRAAVERAGSPAAT
jgi:acetyl esterase